MSDAAWLATSLVVSVVVVARAASQALKSCLHTFGEMRKLEKSKVDEEKLEKLEKRIESVEGVARAGKLGQILRK